MLLKRIIKLLILSIFYIIVAPFGYLSKAEYVLIHSTLFFDFFSKLFSLVPGFPGYYVRTCYYKQTLKESHLDLDIGFGSFVSKPDAKIGRRVLITGFTSIGNVDIGDDAVIANYVSLLSGKYQHNFTDPDRPILDNSDTFGKITIGSNSFVGDHSVVMANIGSHSIIGAGSIVNKEIPDYVVAAGNPARVLKHRK